MNHKAFYNGIVETYKKAGLQEENLLKDVLCMWNSLHPYQKQAVAEAAVANWEMEIGGWPYCRDDMHKMAEGNPIYGNLPEIAGRFGQGLQNIGSGIRGGFQKVKQVGRVANRELNSVDAAGGVQQHLNNMSETSGAAAGAGAVRGGMQELGSKMKQWAPYLIGPAIGALGGGMMGGWRGAAGGALAGAAGAYGYNQMQNPESWMSKQYNSIFNKPKPQVQNAEYRYGSLGPKSTANRAAETGNVDQTNVLATDPSQNKLQQQ